jgi:hypothetical protein
MSEVKLSIDYDQHEEGLEMSKLIEDLAASEESAKLESLIIGDWGAAYENSSDEIVATLVRLKDRFPALRKLFIGDMSYEECEVSWITQGNLGPLFAAFPQLRSLTIKGSTGLELEPAAHAQLQELVIICGGLGKDVLASIAGGHFPELEKLELYLGVDNYGFDGDLSDVLPLAEPGKFPKLGYLGLKDSEIQDEIAAALADAPILDQLHTLDLSQGTLTDAGAEALINSARIRKLKKLDLSYHYMSKAMMERWTTTGVNVDLSDEQGEDEDYRYPSLTE